MWTTTRHYSTTVMGDPTPTLQPTRLLGFKAHLQKSTCPGLSIRFTSRPSAIFSAIVTLREPWRRRQGMHDGEEMRIDQKGKSQATGGGTRAGTTGVGVCL